MSSPETFQNGPATGFRRPPTHGSETFQQPQLRHASQETDTTAHPRGLGGHDPKQQKQNASNAAKEEGLNYDKPEGLPKGKPRGYEKIIGKMEKSMGSIVNDPFLIEKGKLRHSGVLAARREQSRN